MESVMDLLDFEAKTCKTDPIYEGEIDFMHEDWGTTSMKLSRRTSTNSQKPFKAFGVPAEPEHSIRAFLKREPQRFMIETPLSEFSMFDDQFSTSVSAEDASSCLGCNFREPTTRVSGTLTLSQLAIRMVNDEKLIISDYSNRLELVEKMFLANILFLKNGAKVSHELDTADFVAKINENLGDSKTKRNDDRLRFVYKRAIKWLLQKCSGYEANKLHRMQDYEEKLVRQYFPNQIGIREELMDTSFASKKKLQKLFRLSPQFKEEFVVFTKNQMKAFYTKYTQETYSSMLKILSAEFVKSGEIGADFLQKHYKRLPWKSADLTLTVRHIVALSIS